MSVSLQYDIISFSNWSTMLRIFVNLQQIRFPKIYGDERMSDYIFPNNAFLCISILIPFLSKNKIRIFQTYKKIPGMFLLVIKTHMQPLTILEKIFNPNLYYTRFMKYRGKKSIFFSFICNQAHNYRISSTRYRISRDDMIYVILFLQDYTQY